jgi:hypothetical protein
MKKSIKYIVLASFFTPLLASAQFVSTQNLIERFGAIVQYSISLLAAIALLVFFWGLVKFIRKAGEGDVKEGKAIMLWGIIALFIMISIWGIVRFMQHELLPGADYSSPLGATLQNSNSGNPSSSNASSNLYGSNNPDSPWSDIPPGYEDPNQ